MSVPFAIPSPIPAAFRAAFPTTIPIFTGFWFLGITYGTYMASLGFAWYYPTLMALVIFAGSLEFLISGALVSAFHPFAALMVTLMVQARHIFYGISLLKTYQGTGWKKPYLIFGMCDETFSINYSITPPAHVDRGWFMFFVTALNHAYWVSGAVIGGIFGHLLPFDTTGLSFAMTALFVVIFLDQWATQPNRAPAFIGAGCALTSLFIFGPDNFMVPALASMTLILILARTAIDDETSQPQ